METFRSNKEAYVRIMKSKFFITTIISFVLVLVFGVMVLHKTIIINQNGHQMEVKTFAFNVKSLLDKQGIEINENDHITPELNARLKDGDEIIIRKAFEVKLIDGDIESSIFTVEQTVEHILDSQNIEINEFDILEPSLETLVTEGTDIKITRIKKEIVYETYEIPYKTVTKFTDELDHGKTRKVQEGTNGLKEKKYEVIYENGLEAKRVILEETDKIVAVDEVIEKGTSGFIVTSRGETRRYSDVYVMQASAYTAGYESTGKKPGDPYYGITKSGTQVRPGVVAVDPKVIPLGSRLYIESMDGKVSYGIAYAEDTGSSIKGNKIDIYFENLADAKRFGRRQLKVYVLK